MLSKEERQGIRDFHSYGECQDFDTTLLATWIGQLLDTCDALESVAKSEYRRGYTEGVTLYAWWKDGVQYVGCGMRTLKEALKDVE